MADLPNTWWKEFEDLGEEEVRKRLGAHIWLEDKEKLARQWLQSGEAAKAAENRRDTLALAKEANDIAKGANDLARSNNIIATFALIVGVIALALSIFGFFLKSH